MNLPIRWRQYIRVVAGAIIALCFSGNIYAQDIKVPADAPVKIEADNLAYDNDRDVYLAEGNVVITYGDGVLTAASVEYDRKNNLATAAGRRISENGRRFSARR